MPLLERRDWKRGRLLVVVVHVLDDLPHPPAHPEQVGVEAVLAVPVAAFTPRHNADLVPAVLSRVLLRYEERPTFMSYNRSLSRF